jgi:hypothetical protein
MKGRHFDTTEVIEAESQSVLNTLTEHDFQGAFRNGKGAGNGTSGDTLSVRVENWPKVHFFFTR